MKVTVPSPPDRSTRSCLAYTDKVKEYPYDPRSRRALADAGGRKERTVFGEGRQEFVFSAITAKGVLDGVQLATIAQQYYKQLGLDMKIDIVDFGDLWKRPFVGDFDASVEYLVTAPTPDVTSSYAVMQVLIDGSFVTRVRGLLLKARATTDQTTQARYYHEFEKRIAELQPMYSSIIRKKSWPSTRESELSKDGLSACVDACRESTDQVRQMVRWLAINPDSEFVAPLSLGFFWGRHV